MTTTRQLAQADQLREQHDATASKIRARPELSDQGRASLLAKNYVDAKTKMTELERSAAGDATASRSRTEKSAFGTSGLPGDPATIAVSYRDAQDRAATLTSSSDALALLARAERSGDEPLARAIAAHSYDQSSSALGRLDPGWADVVDTYAATRPTAATNVNTLRNLSIPSGIRDMFSYVLAMPSELSRVLPSQLQNLADSAP